MSNSVQPHRRQPRPWDNPGKSIGVGCHFLLQCVKVKLLSHVRLLATPWTAAHQAPPSMGYSRQEYWSGVPLPSPSQKTGHCYSLLSHLFPACNSQVNSSSRENPSGLTCSLHDLLQRRFVWMLRAFTPGPPASSLPLSDSIAPSAAVRRSQLSPHLPGTLLLLQTCPSLNPFIWLTSLSPSRLK